MLQDQNVHLKFKQGAKTEQCIFKELIPTLKAQNSEEGEETDCRDSSSELQAARNQQKKKKDVFINICLVKLPRSNECIS